MNLFKMQMKSLLFFNMIELKVTIAGESAGSMSVIALYLSKAAKGLFQGAIAQSGVMNMPMLYQNEPSINHFRLVSYCNDIGRGWGKKK